LHARRSFRNHPHCPSIDGVLLHMCKYAQIVHSTRFWHSPKNDVNSRKKAATRCQCLLFTSKHCPSCGWLGEEYAGPRTSAHAFSKITQRHAVTKLHCPSCDFTNETQHCPSCDWLGRHTNKISYIAADYHTHHTTAHHDQNCGTAARLISLPYAFCAHHMPHLE
jgi:hypothetical protein